MMIYGQPDMIDRFYEWNKTDQRLKNMAEEELWPVSCLDTLKEDKNDNGSILVLDPTDTQVLRQLYQYGWKDIYFPVCGTVLSIRDEQADDILKGKLEGSTNWKWQKEANRFRMLRSYFYRQKIMDSLPAHIQLEHTSFCNAACIMCGHAIYGNRGAQHISQKMIDRIESLLPTCELMVLHGYGEPLMTKNLPEILELYNKYEVEITTNTNLSYLPSELLEQLIPVVRHLRISCDGVTKEMYEKIRPGLKFERFLENLDKLRKKAPDIELMMEVVIMRQNVEQMPQMVRFAREQGFSQISLNRLGSHPVLNNACDCLTHYPALTSYYLKKAIEEGERLGIRVYYPMEWLLPDETYEQMEEERRRASGLPFVQEPLFCAEDQKMMIHNASLIGPDHPSLHAGIHTCSGICDSLLGRTNLDLEGNIYACCMNTLQKVGNLFELKDDEFYNVPPLVAMRESFYRGQVPRYCDACTYVMNRTIALADVKGGGTNV